MSRRRSPAPRPRRGGTVPLRRGSSIWRPFGWGLICQVAVEEPSASPPLDRITAALGAAVLGATALLYWLTAARDIVVGDTAELAAVALTLGVAHPPGYPLLTLLGHAFSWLPVGPEPFRLNLLAVACGAGTVSVVYLTAYRLVGDRLAAALAALLLAVNPLFWAWSLAFEAFPLNSLIAAGMVYLLVLWRHSAAAQGQLHLAPRRPRLDLPGGPVVSVGAALLAGLGLANHQTIVLLGPAVLYLLRQCAAAQGQLHLAALRPGLDLPGRTMAACAVAFAVGLLPYAYVPWAAASDPYWNWMGVASPGDLFALVTRQNYGSGQLATVGIFQGGSPLDRLGALVTSFTMPELVLVTVGWVAAYRMRRWYAWFAALALLFVGPAFVAYANINLATPGARFILERFFLLAHVVAAPLAAFGVVLLGQAVQGMGGGRLGWGGTRAVLPVILLASIAWIAVVTYPAVDQSGSHIARRFAEDVLASLPPDGVLLVNGDETSFPVGYLQAVENQRPDVTMVIMGLLGNEWYVRQLRLPRARLQVPFARHDGRTATLAMLIAANPGRPFALVGPPVDDTLLQSHAVFGPGLVGEIRPGGTQVRVAQLVEDAERLYGLYRPPSPAEVKPGTFERGILTQYAGGAFRVATELERGGFRDEARSWYERALAIDPELRPARDGLARVRG